MAIIGITFTIEHNDTYTPRREAFLEKMEKFNIINDETTSTLFLDTASSVEDVKMACYNALDYGTDKAIVFETYKHTSDKFGTAKGL